MKKILTLAIALVMVFAIAAPAFAAGWDNPVTPDEFEDLKLNITALSVEPSSSVWNGGTYNKLENTYPIVAGMKVHAYAEVEIPAKSDLSPDIQDRMKKGQAVLNISVSNLEDVELKCLFKGYNPYPERTTVNKYGECDFEIWDNAWGETVTVEVVGSVIKSDKDAKITATLGVYNEWTQTGTGEDAENDTFTFFGKDGKEYSIKKNGRDNADYVVYRNTNGKANGIRFYTNDNGQLQNCKVVLNDQAYLVLDSFAGDIEFSEDGGAIVTNPDTKRDIKAVLDTFLDAMGFEYSGRAYITDRLIVKNLGTIVESDISLVYPTGYVQLVTSDPSVKPPQTGDNASVVGFVMIAVALVAAAAVTVKKVRA